MINCRSAPRNTPKRTPRTSSAPMRRSASTADASPDFTLH
jgi:hypothetical protein